MTLHCHKCGAPIAWLSEYTGTDGDGYWIRPHNRPKLKWWHRRRACDVTHYIVAPPGEAPWRVRERQA